MTYEFATWALPWVIVLWLLVRFARLIVRNHESHDYDKKPVGKPGLFMSFTFFLVLGFTLGRLVERFW